MTILGILVLVLGILCIMSPMAAGVATASFVAVFLVAAGAIRLVWAFKAESFGKGALAFLLGAVSIGGGILLLGRPLLGVTSLTLLLAGYFVVEGISVTVASFKLRPEPGWGWMLMDGVVTLILAWMIGSEWPLSGAWAVGTLVGVRLLIAGWTMIFLRPAAGRESHAVAG